MKKSYLFIIGSFFLLISMSSLTSDKDPRTLKEVYKEAFKMGCAVNDSIVRGLDTVSQHLIVQQFNSITPENVLKAETVHPKPNVWNFGPGDAFVKFGEAHHMFIIGHTLIWHNQVPAWFFKDKNGNPKSHDALVALMKNYIKTVAGRYEGRINAWDVVNEVIDNDGSYRNTAWVKGIGNGDELVKLAFKFASRYAPGTELYYNDFNVWRPTKRDGIARMIRMLKKAGIRIDGVGIQGHWGLDYPKSKYIQAAIDTFATLGVKVMITEMDVDVLPVTKEGQLIGNIMSDPQWQLEEFKTFLDPYAKGLPPKVEEQLAERYAELFRIFYKNRDKIDRVTLWGLHDGMSWKNNYPVPGRTNYPLLYNRDKTPKQALDSVLNVPQSKT